MRERVLIIGIGRAGLRHQKTLADLGYNCLTCDIDPSKGAMFSNPEEALWTCHDISAVIICTPPDQHLADIQLCLSFGIPVLCEKPLCGFGELGMAEELSEHSNTNLVHIAYNYRYNPDIDFGIVSDYYDQLMGTEQEIHLYASQYRKLPPWGIVLDHMSHDVDLFRALFGDMAIESAEVSETPEKVMGIASGKLLLSGLPFYICDEARKEPCQRVAQVGMGIYQFEMTPNPAMFLNMERRFIDFVDGKASYMMSTLSDAIETQKVLEKINKLSSGK